METGNFGGGKGWFSGKAKNLPLVNSLESFENDVMGITPVTPMNENESSSPNDLPNQDQGFAPFHSFENDVLGQTVIDPDSDWQI